MPTCHLAHRALMRLSGPDVRPFLQGQITHDMALLAPDRPLYAGLLSPQGKALFQLFLFADGDDVLLDVAAAQADALAKRLLMFRLRRQVAIEAEAGLAVFQGWGEPSDRPADPRLPEAGHRFIGPPAAGDATLEDWHARRLSLGLPDADEIGQDELLWLETNARELDGVSFTKGCYTGQENTARMHHRDRVRKRLLPLRLAGEGAEDAPVMAGERVAGSLRGRRHGELQMALLRTEQLGEPLTVAGAPAHLVRPGWLQD
ncbi:MAG: YgfZ/GcvT domain-containing protein [Sphingomonadaceae bacterium]